MRAHKAQHALRETKLRLVACKKQLILHLPCGQASSGQLWRKVTAKAMLDIGFASRWRSQELAAVHAVSKSWVRALRLYVVSMCLACQNLVLGSIIMMACRDAPFFLMTRLAWDETGEKVTVGVDTTETSVWQVLVARLRMIIAWKVPSGFRTFSYVFILPPLIVPSTGAASIWHTLFFSQLTGPLLHAVHMLRKKAQVVIDLNETDGAYANDKLCAHLFAESSLTTLWEHVHCSLHANQLIEVAVMSICPKLLSKLYSLAIFFRTSGYFTKMTRVLKRP